MYSFSLNFTLYDSAISSAAILQPRGLSTDYLGVIRQDVHVADEEEGEPACYAWDGFVED